MPGSEDQAAWVRRVLGAEVAGAGRVQAEVRGATLRGSHEGAVVRLGKGMLLWNGTRDHIVNEIKRLQDAIVSRTAAEPNHKEICGNLGNLDRIWEVLDNRLTGKMNELRGTADEAAKSKLSAEARKIVADYLTFVEREPLMQDIDDNGFIPLAIKPRVTEALTAIAALI